MKIIIDEIEIPVSDINKNIVQIAEESGIVILAPCYRSKRKGGCCKACLIKVDGNIKYACGTKPTDGMNIEYNNPDLKKAREIAIKNYAKNIKNASGNSCCSSDVSTIQGNDCCSNSGCNCS